MGKDIPKNMKPYQFKQGQSGNPGGKSKQQRAIEAQFVKAINEIKITLKEEGKPKQVLPCMEALTRKLVVLAFEGEKPWAFQLLFKHLLPASFNVAVYMEHSGKVETGNQVLDLDQMLKGLSISKKQKEELKKRYLEAMFPGRGFTDSDMEVKPQ